MFGSGSDVTSTPSLRALHVLAATLRILRREQQLSEQEMRTGVRSFGIWGFRVRGVRLASQRPRTTSYWSGLLYPSDARTCSAHRTRGAADPVAGRKSSKCCEGSIGRVCTQHAAHFCALHIIVQSSFDMGSLSRDSPVWLDPVDKLLSLSAGNRRRNMTWV